MSFGDAPPSSGIARALNSSKCTFALGLIPIAFASAPFGSVVGKHFLSLTAAGGPSPRGSALQLGEPGFLKCHGQMSRFGYVAIPSYEAAYVYSPRKAFGSTCSITRGAPILSTEGREGVLEGGGKVGATTTVDPQQWRAVFFSNFVYPVGHSHVHSSNAK